MFDRNSQSKLANMNLKKSFSLREIADRKSQRSAPPAWPPFHAELKPGTTNFPVTEPTTL
jgi:hypothetical protein